MTTPPDWERIQANAIERAENGHEGLVTFAAMSSNPVQSMFLTTQEERDDGTGLRNFHLHIVSQPSNYPDTPRDMNLTQREGYRRYLRRVLVEQRGNGIDVVPLSISEWRSRFMEVAAVIDESIRDCHGVQCHEDGDLNNHHVSNVFYMHVCDIMNIYQRRLIGEAPVLYLPSPTLDQIKLETRNMLTDRMLNRRQLNFFLQEIDFFYNCFAYFGNYSFVPIRTLVEEMGDTWPTATFYTHDNHFREHQEGKLNVIERDQNRMFSRVCYRTP
jgi:hypothetical protein